MTRYVWTPEAEARVEKALADGWSQRRIAREIGCTPSNVNKVARRIEFRNQQPVTVKLTDEQRREQKEQFRSVVRWLTREQAATEAVEEPTP